MNVMTMNRLVIFTIAFVAFCCVDADVPPAVSESSAEVAIDESNPDPLLSVFASTRDIFRSARGIGLSFVRVFSAVRDLRFERGGLGYGWADNLSIRIEKGKEKFFVRFPSGERQEFAKVDGQWRPQDGRDAAKVSETSAAFVFTFEDGTVQSFSKTNRRTSFIQDNKGNTLSFTWDGDRLQRVTHTDGQCLSFAYSPDGLLSSVVDDCGRKTEYAYKDDLLTEVKSSGGLVTRYEYYDMDGAPTSRAIRRILRPDGTVRSYEFDERGRVTAIVENGIRTEIRRRGRTSATIVAPDGGETIFEFGKSGEMVQMTDALGNVTKLEYGKDGLLASVMSPSGKEASLCYDSRGRMKSVKSPSGAKTAFSYEKAFGNLASVTDANGQAVLYEYDDVGRGVSVMHPDGTASKVGYNPRGDAVSVLNRRGQSIKMDYDAQGRPVRKVWPNGRTFAYVYDMRGNLMSAVDSETGAVRMEYDVAGRMTRIAYPKGRGLAFKYDAVGRLVERTLFDDAAKSSLSANVERFAYNDTGRLASVADGNGRKYIENAYDTKTGRLTRQTCGNGVASEYGYDRLGRIASIRHAGASAVRAFFEYSYDSDGKCRTTRSNEGNETHEYDADGQLATVIYPDGKKESFKYDAVGNRVSANGVIYTANALNQYTEIVGEVTHVSATYDLDGNLTSLADKVGKTQYWYDVQNRLVAVTNEAAGIRWCCQYDALGNRVLVTDNGITTERVMIPGILSSVAAEYVNGQLKKRHIVVGAVRLASLTTHNSQLTTSFYHGDIIGSVRLITGDEGKEVSRASYTAFGTFREGRASARPQSVGYVGILGVETDPTGLLFMRNRYYSPTLGRFIQPDPIGLNGEDVNWYRYCGNEPVIKVDVDGFRSFWQNMGYIVTGGSFVIGGVISGMSAPWTGALGVGGAIAGVGGGVGLIADGVIDMFGEKPQVSTFLEDFDMGEQEKIQRDMDYYEKVMRRERKQWNDYWQNPKGKTFLQNLKDVGKAIIGVKDAEAATWFPEQQSQVVQQQDNQTQVEHHGGNKPQATQNKEKRQRNRRERKARGSDEDSDRELSESEIPDPNDDDYIWCEDVCEERPLVPSDTPHCVYWGCSRCGHVIRKQAKKAKRQEKIWKSQGKDCWWHGTQFEIRQAQSVE